jgi:hypothetical protein
MRGYRCRMVAQSPEAFRDAVSSHRLDHVRLDPHSLRLAQRSLTDSGLLMVGESHGVYETPAALYALARALGTRAIALEWAHEEMQDEVESFMRDGTFDFARLWSSLPAAAEFFSGDGRITAGHFALLGRLKAEAWLDQVILFDRLDDGTEAQDPLRRDREMAGRMLATWSEAPALVVAGAFHARLDVEGSMARHLAQRRAGLLSMMLQYSSGHCWASGRLHDVSAPMPDAPIVLRLDDASPAIVPGR